MKFILLSKDEGKREITKPDDYLASLKPFERGLKIGKRNDVTMDTFTEHLSNCVLEWTIQETEKINKALSKLAEILEKYPITAPETVFLIKTNGKDEWNSAYTRENCIYMPEKKLRDYTDRKLLSLLAHEFFHCFSRLNPETRERLYALLEFYPYKEVIPQKELTATLVNPDAMTPVYTLIESKGRIIKVCPFIFVKKEGIDDSMDIFDNIRIDFYWPEEKADASEIMAKYTEKLCINTTDYQHPEETLAENFAHLITENKTIQNKDLINNIETIILEAENA
ncbi:MAG TPA: hypothetical protein PK466_12765 [Thermotogota bacterium]|nr:hypothetical protein [Thermotogota bacterium]HPJ88724.1 hypothetical protein [Thermotogota bacterium]HPR97194.1 hypothetical protein [Thermotogota bacterium]